MLKKNESSKLDKKQVRRIYKERIYHLLLFFIISVCLAMFFFGTCINLTRLIVLNYQTNELKQLNASAKEKNLLLKGQLKIYSSYKGIEELARNNLKMVGEDEVLVLIKNASSSDKE